LGRCGAAGGWGDGRVEGRIGGVRGVVIRIGGVVRVGGVVREQDGSLNWSTCTVTLERETPEIGETSRSHFTFFRLHQPGGAPSPCRAGSSKNASYDNDLLIV
jgi:hypothetical protein